MPRLDVTPDHPLLVRVLGDPNQLQSLSPQQFSRLIDAADNARLLGWLLSEVDRRRIPRDPPDWLNDRLLTVKALVLEYERAVRWEIDRLDRALSGAGLPWILLKGAAYVAASLPPGRGRRVADIDILVPFELLATAEKVLNEHGWHVGEIDAYSERYYREWMHELPPMVHKERKSVVDVHHAILPRTSRLRPSASRLTARAIRVDGDVRVLCPAHMVLHAAAHLFHDGEIAGAIRDVVDLDGLLRRFGEEADFWGDFVKESHELGLTRPAYYALRYSRRLLDTPVPRDVLAAMDVSGPVRPVRWLMDTLVDRTLPGKAVRISSAAAFALYLRSHWLRMPLALLLRHLVRQSVRRHKT
jgi:hypothetical protein